MRSAPRQEFVPAGQAIYQSDRAQTYCCPTCRESVFTQHEGNEHPAKIVCHGFLAGHTVYWNSADPVHKGRG